MQYQKHPLGVLSYHTDPSLHWTLRDTILMLSVTVVYAVVALCNLGSLKAPQTFWTSTASDEQVLLDLGQEYDQFTITYYCGVTYRNFSVDVSSDGEEWSEESLAQMNEGSCYQWKYITPSYEYNDTTYFTNGSHLADVSRFSGRYVRVHAKQIGLKLGELIFRTKDGRSIKASVVSRTGANEDSPLLSNPAMIVDEPDSLEGQPGWYTGTYFDEIYHARTGMELYEGDSPYEWTHPPLGKVFMSWCIGIFGMTPFGWRFAGCLMGILMLPGMYLLGKQLTKRTSMAFLAMLLMALDCMHLTQTRIATIDSFPVLFIILSFFFMLRFMQSDMTQTGMRKLMINLLCSGFFIGLGIASKWIALYAGAGLALLYFWTLCRHLRMRAEAARMLACDDINENERTILTNRLQNTWKRIIQLCLWCVLVFVLLPVAIYLLSYIPHFAYAHPQSLKEFINLVITEQQRMYSYHSSPGLGMDHAFYSPWYEWPLIKRPMYYAMASFMPSGYSQSIFAFGNPTVWITGLLGIAATLLIWLYRHIYLIEGSNTPLHLRASSWSTAPAFILIGLLAQFLPWVLVPRGTYIYHYFASIPFLILGIVYMFHHFTLHVPKAGKIILIVYAVIVLVAFIAFYPYASGVPTPVWWLDFMKRFLHVYYSI